MRRFCIIQGRRWPSSPRHRDACGAVGSILFFPLYHPARVAYACVSPPLFRAHENESDLVGPPPAEYDWWKPCSRRLQGRTRGMLVRWTRPPHPHVVQPKESKLLILVLPCVKVCRRSEGRVNDAAQTAHSFRLRPLVFLSLGQIIV
jgi:hypothetical protein